MIRKPRSFKRAIPAFGLALIASIALSAFAVGSASAATQHWYKCQPGGGALNYKDSACSEETIPGIGSYGLIKLNEGTATNFAMNGTSTFSLRWVVSGSKIVLNCSTQTSEEGTVKNPTGGGAGTAELRLILKNCTTSAPKNCVAPPIEIYGLQGDATELGGKPAVRFHYPSTYLFQVTLEGPECSFHSTFLFSGEFTGVMSKGGSLEFTEASSNLKYGASKASLIGTSALKNTAGEFLGLAP